MTTDSYVRGAPDSTGKYVDTSELTNSAGVLVERQRVVVGSDCNANALAPVSAVDGLRVNDQTLVGVLQLLLAENRKHTLLLQLIAGVNDDFSDPSLFQ